MQHAFRRFSLLFAIGSALLLGANAAHAQLPVTQLFALSPPGGQQGTTLDVTITAGADRMAPRDFTFRILASRPP